MSENKTTLFKTQSGYMTDGVRRAYIKKAIDNGLLPKDADRMAPIISLNASPDKSKPIQFWQLFSVMGPQRLVDITQRFYERVYNDEPWFTSVFERIGSKEHHVNTQSAMWADTMGGGPYYHGADYRLHFHHYHNAMELMNDKGAKRWVELMKETLEEPGIDYTDDPRVRPAINTFLSYFMGKYAQEFKFSDDSYFGETNPPYKRRINFLKLSEDAITNLEENELIEELNARGVDTSQLTSKKDLVNKALSL